MLGIMGEPPAGPRFKDSARTVLKPLGDSISTNPSGAFEVAEKDYDLSTNVSSAIPTANVARLPGAQAVVEAVPVVDNSIHFRIQELERQLDAANQNIRDLQMGAAPSELRGIPEEASNVEPQRKFPLRRACALIALLVLVCAIAAAFLISPPSPEEPTPTTANQVDTLMWYVVFQSTYFSLAPESSGNNTSCDICGCSFCTFADENPTGMIPISDEFIEALGGETTKATAPKTRQMLEDLFGITEISCAALDLAGKMGAFAPDTCVDQLRLNPILREACGCRDQNPEIPPDSKVKPLPEEWKSNSIGKVAEGDGAYQVQTLLWFIVFQSIFVDLAPELTGNHAICEICGCSNCPFGQFPMGNPEGVIQLNDEFVKQFSGDETTNAYNVVEGLQMLQDLFGATEVICSDLHLAGRNGVFPNTTCVDQLRLNPILRETCGCPILPNTTSSEVAVDVAVDSSIKVQAFFLWVWGWYVVAELSPEGNYPSCDVCGCEFCVDGEYPIENPTAVIPITPEFINGFGGEPVNDDNYEGIWKGVQHAENKLNVTWIQCSSLVNAGMNGFLPPGICIDKLRLNDVMREECGCRPLPPRPANYKVEPLSDEWLQLAQAIAAAFLISPPSPEEPSPTTVEEEASPTDTAHQVQYLLWWIVIESTIFKLEPEVSKGKHPECDICGCSWCVDQIPMENFDGVITLNDEFLNGFQGEQVNGTSNFKGREALENLIISTQNATALSCSDLYYAGRGGAFTPKLCVDQLRMNSVLRTACGCHDAPTRPSDYKLQPLPVEFKRDFFSFEE